MSDIGPISVKEANIGLYQSSSKISAVHSAPYELVTVVHTPVQQGAILLLLTIFLCLSNITWYNFSSTQYYKWNVHHPSCADIGLTSVSAEIDPEISVLYRKWKQYRDGCRSSWCSPSWRECRNDFDESCLSICCRYGPSTKYETFQKCFHSVLELLLHITTDSSTIGSIQTDFPLLQALNSFMSVLRFRHSHEKDPAIVLCQQDGPGGGHVL